MNLVLKLCRIANQSPVFFAANCIDSTPGMIRGSRIFYSGLKPGKQF